ncbi:peptidoglycan recognition family protein [Leptolyngbya sp. PCC 6406]|uniref:peptidoglycan recognition protein family protein n=1 Tax=Leptolyngbya sp. PCC 6406 TaxID=1173264 RepID=UPI0002ACB438|nr:peptidoglycan recognition family protein [Leptolyngbya sp. PCC 6406]
MAINQAAGLPEIADAMVITLVPTPKDDPTATQDLVLVREATAPQESNAVLSRNPGQNKNAPQNRNPGQTRATAPLVAQTPPTYQPRQEIALADPSNYGDRYGTDAYGHPVNNQFIAVLHETVGSAQSALNLFRTYHANDADQVSYHTLIGLDGTVYYIVPPENRAYGAGNSVFDGPNGPETVTTNPAFPPSVNNFAYHVSLETPSDGRGNSTTHSGYTQAQYDSLAWLLSRSNIPDNRITTHRRVDRSGSRLDPRSFDFTRLLTLLHRYPNRSGLSG